MKYKILAIVGIGFLLAGCNDYLDKDPLSKIPEEMYLTSDKHLDSYVMERYPTLWSHSLSGGYNTLLGADSGTDDKTSPKAEAVDMFASGGAGIAVPTSGGAWNFYSIRKCNYFFDRVLPQFEAQKLAGDQKKIKHYIGEMYFFRAYEYFKLYSELGDLPILKNVLELDEEKLIEASRRQPRNEVARFMLQDLDKAIELLMDVSPDGKKNRLNKKAAYLFKSRVALFEGSWLKNFAGTQFVPNGAGWPGAKAHPGYKFPAGDITSEANWFFEQALSAAQVVADETSLIQQNSTKSLQQDINKEANPYYDMFALNDLSEFEEILVWKDYDISIGVKHGTANAVIYGNYFQGTTKSFVESFLMQNGLPIYADGSGYAGDNSTFDVVKDRDTRLQLFLKLPGQKNRLTNLKVNSQYAPVEGYPILGDAQRGYTTGYAIRKYGPTDGLQFVAMTSDNGCPLFRAAEAYLNYIEADYLRNGNVGTKSNGYWKALRQRAGVNEDFNKTIAATVMEKEKEDWGAYTAGRLIDPTLYNIRRERRNELMSEGFRLNDLRRWRALDQMIKTPYIVKGFKLWNSKMSGWNFTNKLVECGKKGANVSAKSDGDYLCPYRIVKNNVHFNGFVWTMAHYLTPIAANHFLLTGGDESVIYQNPGWSIIGGDIAQDIN